MRNKSRTDGIVESCRLGVRVGCGGLPTTTNKAPPVT